MIFRLFASIVTIVCFARLAVAEDAPAQVTLGNARLHFTPPPAANWERVEKSTDRLVAFTSVKHDAIVAFELLPDDMTINKAVTAAIIKQLRGEHQKSKAKMLLEPTAEADERFALKVHERYEVGKTDPKKVSDQLHMYLYVGKYLMMATVNSVADDPATVDATHREAEDALLSATAPGVKPRKVLPRPATKPTPKPKTPTP